MIEEIRDKDEITKILPEVLDLIHLTYGDDFLGSTDLKRLRKSTSLIQAVRNSDGKLIAGSLCRQYLSSDKISAIFSDRSTKGKTAAVSIIRKNIEEYQSLVWCEASGAVEHYYRKYEGYPIPNVYAAEILRKPQDEIELLIDDHFQYSRVIGTDNLKKKVEKVIYGFPSKKLMDQFIADSKYQEERKLFNVIPKLSESIHDDMPEDLYYAASFIEQLSDLTEEGKIIEMSPQLSAILDNSMKTLKEYIGKIDWVKNDYNVAEYLREEIPVIKVGNMKEVVDNLSTEFI